MGVIAESGAHHPMSTKGRAHADKYYKSVRLREFDCIQVSENTGLGIEIVSAIKSHIFFTKHVLTEGV